MLFGLPWFAVVAIISVVGGLFYAYKEKEMEMEGKRAGSARELNELRQIVHNLKSRVENLEAIASEERTSRQKEKSDGLADIEIEEEEISSDPDSSNIKNNLRN